MNSDDKRQGHVLVVDDEPGPRESLRFLLYKRYHVHTADNVADGLDILREAPIDVIVLDINMPEVDGITGLRRIRQIDDSVAVILLTGYASLETATEAVRLGADDYVYKPFDVYEMKERIDQHFLKARVRQERDRSLTELSRLNEELCDRLAEHKGLAALGESSQSMVEQLANPLTVAFGYMQILMGKLQRDPASVPPDQLLSYLEQMQLGLQHSKGLADLWRSVSQDPAFVQLDLTVLTRRLLDHLHKQAESLGVQLNRSLPDNEPLLISGNSSQLRRALTNLVVNALQASAQGKGEVKVTVKRLDDRIAVDVEDNGTGIPSGMREIVFQPFTTTKTDGESGLGLYIARRIAEIHGGTLTLDDQATGRTVFRLSLPAAHQRP